MQKRDCRQASARQWALAATRFWERPRCIDFCYDAIAVSVIWCLLMTDRCCFKSRTTTREIAAKLIKRLFADQLSAQPLPVAPAPSQGVETTVVLYILLMTHGKPARSQRLLI
jgi:hypothetical protein